ncbi:MAG: hypothetical protein WBA23_09365 [Tunicatimonas sp.]|uniref:hypothetical protein n=1 Tax=Tunicatimonas sp. TaxID=1940096 RepID=UPI003C75A8E3
MEKILCALLIIAGLLACNPDKERKVNDAEAKFTTSDASELFFKNVRQGYYDKETMDAAKLEIYRIKERNQVEDQPILNVAIVINWRYDEAYIITEPNAYLQQQDTLTIFWQDTAQQQQGTYEYLPGNKESHYQLASRIYNSLQDKHQLYIPSPEGEQVPFLARRSEREAFRKTMVDYYRLVDLY